MPKPYHYRKPLTRPPDEPVRRKRPWFPRPMLPELPPAIRFYRRQRHTGEAENLRAKRQRYWVRPGYWYGGGRGAWRIPNDALNVYEAFAFAPGDGRDYGLPADMSATLPFDLTLPLPTSGTHEVGVVVRKRNAYGLTDFIEAETPRYVKSTGDAGAASLNTPYHVELTHDSSGDVSITAYYAEEADGYDESKRWVGVYQTVDADGIIDSGVITFTDSAVNSTGGIAVLRDTILTGLADGTIVTVYLLVQETAMILPASSAYVIVTLTVDTTAPAAPTIRTSFGQDTEIG